MDVMTEVREPLTRGALETADSWRQLRFYFRGVSNPSALASQMKGKGKLSVCGVQLAVPI